MIQGNWIQDNAKKLTLTPEFNTYLSNAISLHHTALIVTGNDRAYFSLYSMRAIIERVALVWTAHPSSTVNSADVIKKLGGNDMAKRRQATQSFVEQAESFDPVFGPFYNMISQYFAHASKMDIVSLEGNEQKDIMLRRRVKVLPLLILLDLGDRFVRLICELLQQQGHSVTVPAGGRNHQVSIDQYVRLCCYVACEKHSPKKGVPIGTLLKNMADIEGEIGLNHIYRGGMELVRFGDPKKKPPPQEIAEFAWYGIGRDHDDEVKVKCEKEEKNGEVYRLSWPKHLEIDSSGIGMLASYSSAPNFEFFDYLGEFLNVLEKYEVSKVKPSTSSGKSI